MPARSPYIPNYHERSVLEAVCGDRPIPERPKTIKKMIEKGWLKRDVGTEYRATQAGLEALTMKIPERK